MRVLLILLGAGVVALAVSSWLARDSSQPAGGLASASEERDGAVPAMPMSAAPEPQAPAEEDPVADAIATAVLDIVRDRTAEEDVREMEKRLAVAFAEAGAGTEESRGPAAAAAVAQLLERAGAAKSAGRPFSDLKMRSVKQLSRELSRELRRRMPQNQKQQHDPSAMRAMAPDVQVPAGYTSAPWSLLAGFDYQEGNPLPAEVKALNGSAVGITGYMIVLDEDSAGVSEFLLVQSLWDCCFGMPPELHQGVVVRAPGLGVQFTSKPIQVLGTLEVGESRDVTGFVLSVYRMQAAKTSLVD